MSADCSCSGFPSAGRASVIGVGVRRGEQGRSAGGDHSPAPRCAASLLVIASTSERTCAAMWVSAVVGHIDGDAGRLVFSSWGPSTIGGGALAVGGGAGAMLGEMVSVNSGVNTESAVGARALLSALVACIPGVIALRFTPETVISADESSVGLGLVRRGAPMLGVPTLGPVGRRLEARPMAGSRASPGSAAAARTARSNSRRIRAVKAAAMIDCCALVAAPSSWGWSKGPASLAAIAVGERRLSAPETRDGMSARLDGRDMPSMPG